MWRKGNSLAQLMEMYLDTVTMENSMEISIKKKKKLGIKPYDPAIPLLRIYPAAAAKSLESCPTLCDPIDSSPPGSPIPGILQARILKWVAISFSNA